MPTAHGQGTGEDWLEISAWYRISLRGLLRSHARVVVPLEPELAPLEPELAPLLPDDVPLEPLLVPEEPELVPEEPELVPDEPLLVPVSAPESMPLFAGGSFVLFVSGNGSAAFCSCTLPPRSSSGDVAHAVMRAKRDSASEAVRVERRMAGTLTAQLSARPLRLSWETLR